MACMYVVCKCYYYNTIQYNSHSLSYSKTSIAWLILGTHSSASPLCRDGQKQNASISVQTPIVHLVADYTHPKIALPLAL